jgi:hypothetical protein
MQAATIPWQQGKSVMLVEALGGVIFGIHEQSENTQLGTRRSQNRICEESSAEAFALVFQPESGPAE